MSQNQIIATLTEIHELKRMQEELACEIETLQGKIKAHMDETGVETVSYTHLYLENAYRVNSSGGIRAASSFKTHRRLLQSKSSGSAAGNL